MASPKLDIFKMLNAIDKKDYNFYDNLSDDERKGFSAYLGLKWGASVNGDNTLQHYYLASMNNYVNVNKVFSRYYIDDDTNATTS